MGVRETTSCCTEPANQLHEIALAAIVPEWLAIVRRAVALDFWKTGLFRRSEVGTARDPSLLVRPFKSADPV